MSPVVQLIYSFALSRGFVVRRHQQRFVIVTPYRTITVYTFSNTCLGVCDGLSHLIEFRPADILVELCR